MLAMFYYPLIESNLIKSLALQSFACYRLHFAFDLSCDVKEYCSSETVITITFTQRI